MSVRDHVVNINYVRKIYMDLSTMEENEIYDHDNHKYWTTLNEQSLTFEPDTTLFLKNHKGWQVRNPAVDLDPNNNGGVYGWYYVKEDSKVLLIVDGDRDEAYIHAEDELLIKDFMKDYSGLRFENFNCNEIHQGY